MASPAADGDGWASGFRARPASDAKRPLLSFLAAGAALSGGPPVSLWALVPLWTGVGHWLLGPLLWAKQAGWAGAVVFGLVYVLGTLLFFPGSLLTLAAGFLYGLEGGLAVVVPGSLLGATLAFLLGRTVLRKPIAARMARHPRFQAVDEAVGEQAFKVVLLLRLSPVVPFNLLNYALGVTRVSWGSYLSGSVLGMLPGTVLYVYLGSLLTSAAQLLSGHRPASGGLGTALFIVGLVATLAVVLLVGRAARRALDRTLRPSTSRR